MVGRFSVCIEWKSYFYDKLSPALKVDSDIGLLEGFILIHTSAFLSGH